MPFARLSDKNPMIVFGVDPGSYVTGFGVIGRRDEQYLCVDHGVFTARRSERLHQIFVQIRAGLAHHRPDVVALEGAFVRHNPQTAIRIGEARAAALIAAAEASVPVVEYTAPEAKKAVVGHGAATKDAVREFILRRLNMPEDDSLTDATDALALALCLLLDPRLDPRFAAGS